MQLTLLFKRNMLQTVVCCYLRNIELSYIHNETGPTHWVPRINTKHELYILIRGENKLTVS